MGCFFSQNGGHFLPGLASVGFNRQRFEACVMWEMVISSGRIQKHANMSENCHGYGKYGYVLCIANTNYINILLEFIFICLCWRHF